MDLKQLIALGTMPAQKPLKREVEFNRPVVNDAGENEQSKESVTTYIRPFNSADEIELARAEEREQPFVAILRAICDESGVPVFESLEQTERLETWLVLPLFAAIMEARPASPKASQGKKSSGSKSP